MLEGHTVVFKGDILAIVKLLWQPRIKQLKKSCGERLDKSGSGVIDNELDRVGEALQKTTAKKQEIVKRNIKAEKEEVEKKSNNKEKTKDTQFCTFKKLQPRIEELGGRRKEMTEEKLVEKERNSEEH